MEYEFDPAKNSINIRKHRISLASAEYFEWETAVIHEDLREQYPERRFKATGVMYERVHIMIYCLRGNVIRVISFRKANFREVKQYAHHN
jgi:uncharacterized protein